MKKNTVKRSVKSGTGKAKSEKITAFKKDRRASEAVTALSLVKQIYSDAIEITGVARGTRGVLMYLGWLGAIVGLLGVFWSAKHLSELNSVRSVHVVGGAFLFAITICSIYLGIASTRIELFALEDEPTIFDRKNKKVCRISKKKDFSWIGVLRPWPLEISEYDWTLVDAQHHAVLTANGSTVTQVHALVFQVRKSKTDPSTVDGFSIGSSLQMGELIVPAVWEHIRRFMEEQGPPLPNGEQLSPLQRPNSLCGCLGLSGQWRAQMRDLWNSERLLTILAIVAFPVVIPSAILIALFKWLSYKTALPIAWPAYIAAAVGVPQESRT